METQDADAREVGGWDEALRRATADGTRTVHSTRFVYVKNVRWSVEGALPRAGAAGELRLRVVNDDADASGTRPPVAGAAVVVTDAAGHRWRGVTGADGTVRMPVEFVAGAVRVEIEHADFSREVGTIEISA
jgi:hypothetical protein